MYIPTTVLSTTQAAGIDGWVDDSANTWTYVSTAPDVFSTTGDRTAVFSKGTRIKLTQTTVKAFVVTNSSFGAGITSVTVTAGTDYTLTNAAISANYYSYAANPQLYPGVFNYVPTWTSTGTQPVLNNGTLAGQFSVLGRAFIFTVTLTMGGTTTFGTGNYRWAPPITLAGYSHTGSSFSNDTGTAVRTGTLFVDASNNTFRLYTSDATAASEYSNTVPHTWAATDTIQFSGTADF